GLDGLLIKGGDGPADASEVVDAASEVGQDDGSSPDATVDAVADAPGDAGATSAYVEAVLARKPVAYYRFEETFGITPLDDAGNGHHGTYSNVTLSRPSAHPTLGRAGGFTPAASSYVKIPALGTLTKLTIECFVRPAALAGFNVVYNVERFDAGAMHFQL